MSKLTDSQLIVLSAAVARDDGAALIPERMNKAAAMKVGASLVNRKLMREIRSKPGMPPWRDDDEGRHISLVITRAGRDAIGVEDERDEAEPSPKVTKSNTRPPRAPTGGMPGSKQARIVTMLSAKEGATLDALVEATGWLPHTTRAALTGLRKKGFAIERTRDQDKGSLYRIVGEPQTGA